MSSTQLSSLIFPQNVLLFPNLDPLLLFLTEAPLQIYSYVLLLQEIIVNILDQYIYPAKSA